MPFEDSPRVSEQGLSPTSRTTSPYQGPATGGKHEERETKIDPNQFYYII